jgi:hypothetical protein
MMRPEHFSTGEGELLKEIEAKPGMRTDLEPGNRKP